MCRDRARRFVRRHSADVRKFTKRFGHDILVLFGLERASGVSEASARRKPLQRHREQVGLQVIQLGQLLALQSPADFRMTRESSRAGTRRIDENAVKLEAEGKRVCCVEFDEGNLRKRKALKLFTHYAHAVGVKLRRDDQSILSCGAGERWRLSSRSSAQIQNPVTGLRVEKQRDGLRGFVLNRNISALECWSACRAATVNRESRV